MSRYVCDRSHSDKRLFVIYLEGQWETLPAEVRHRGPWQGVRSGDVQRLLLPIRAALARDGYFTTRHDYGRLPIEAV